MFNQRTAEFEYRPGPLFAQIVLADEINRAGPRTQAALLEAMEERQVTVDGATHLLPRPFLVLATQNPVELEGTFPLPEAQVDRLLLCVALGYPAEEEEGAILRRFRESNPLAELAPVVSAEDIADLQQAVRQVYVHPAVETYLLRLTRATRAKEAIQLGASPRGALEFGPAELRSGDMFGFREQLRALTDPDLLIVYPRVVPVTDLGLPAAHPFGDAKALRRLLEDPLRVSGVRPYLPGDSPRFIHWRATARRGELQTKIFDPAAAHTTALSLDLHTLRDSPGIIPDYLEYAISATPHSPASCWTRARPWG